MWEYCCLNFDLILKPYKLLNHACMETCVTYALVTCAVSRRTPRSFANRFYTSTPKRQKDSIILKLYVEHAYASLFGQAGWDRHCCDVRSQECFIGFKTTRLRLVVLDPIKHALRVFWTASKTFLEKRVSIEFITIMLLWTLEISILLKTLNTAY